MKPPLLTLVVALALPASNLPAVGAPDSAPSPFYAGAPAQRPGPAVLLVPPIFERERGVVWDGRIDWRTGERPGAFAAALQGALKGVTRAQSPFRLRVAVVLAEKRTGTFVVEFTIHAPSGESVELVQVEGVCPRQGPEVDLYPHLAEEIVTTFKKSVLQ